MRQRRDDQSKSHLYTVNAGKIKGKVRERSHVIGPNPTLDRSSPALLRPRRQEGGGLAFIKRSHRKFLNCVSYSLNMLTIQS